MMLLVAAMRVYIGGPDGVTVVWKGDLTFADTVININDYLGLPASEFQKHPLLLGQMEDMGFFDEETPRKYRRIRKNSGQQQRAAKVEYATNPNGDSVTGEKPKIEIKDSHNESNQQTGSTPEPKSEKHDD